MHCKKSMNMEKLAQRPLVAIICSKQLWSVQHQMELKTMLCGFQKLDIFEGDLPETTTDLVVNGAGVLMFAANSLSRLRDARRIYISGAGIVLMRANAATNLDVLHLHLDVENCDVFRIEANTFSNIKGKFIL